MQTKRKEQGWQRSRLNRSWRLRKCNRWQNIDWLCNQLRNLDQLGILTVKLSLIYIFYGQDGTSLKDLFEKITMVGLYYMVEII